MKDTRNAQVPWEASSLVGDFYFKPDAAGVGADETACATVGCIPEEVEQELWNSVKGSRDQRDLEGYLKQYPKGRFVPLAQQKLKALATAPHAVKATDHCRFHRAATGDQARTRTGRCRQVLDRPHYRHGVRVDPEGCSKMGSPESEKAVADKRTPTRSLCRGFTGSASTKSPTASTRNSAPINGNADDKLPVAGVSWQDAIALRPVALGEVRQDLKTPHRGRMGIRRAEAALLPPTSGATVCGRISPELRRYAFCTDIKKPVGSHQPNALRPLRHARQRLGVDRVELTMQATAAASGRLPPWTLAAPA